MRVYSATKGRSKFISAYCGDNFIIEIMYTFSDL